MVLRSALRSVTEHQKLIRCQREFRVRLPFVVGEFDLIGAIQEFHDGADLPAHKTMRRHIREERHDIEQVWSGVHCCCLYFRKQLVNRGVRSPRRTIHMLLTIPEPRGPLISNANASARANTKIISTRIDSVVYTRSEQTITCPVMNVTKHNIGLEAAGAQATRMRTHSLYLNRSATDVEQPVL